MKNCLTMEDRGNSMVGNRMTKSRMSNCNWVCNRMSNGNWVSNSMDNWVSNSMMGNMVSNNSCLDNSRSILRNSLIGHILDDSVSIVSVLDSLDPAVRKSNSVAARG